jgi:hypothetical protein
LERPDIFSRNFPRTACRYPQPLAGKPELGTPPIVNNPSCITLSTTCYNRIHHPLPRKTSTLPPPLIGFDSDILCPAEMPANPNKTSPELDENAIPLQCNLTNTGSIVLLINTDFFKNSDSGKAC